MNVFDTNYATIFLDKSEKMVKLRWNGFVRDVQYNMVIDLILQLIEKHQIKTLVEDQTLLRLSSNSTIHPLCALYYSRKFESPPEVYYVSKPTDRMTTRLMATHVYTPSGNDLPKMIEVNSIK